MGPNDYEISIDVSIRNYQGGGNITLRDTLLIPECTFEDMAEILRGFHQLATSIKAARERAREDATA